MAVCKCKMCGGDLNVTELDKVVACDYCGTQQTVPTAQDEGIRALFNRANVLRMKSEFDKAASLYEKIIQNAPEEAEAYWGLILCKYGIEYVEDPATFRRVPTCHRTSYDSVSADEDYKAALRYADALQRSVYEAEAAEIDRLQKEIIALSEKEEPYDVFLCYKETDETGKRTPDSVIANDIYHQLTEEGFKVFYAAITLEDKAGTAYEPYIFAALNSARVMFVIGTKPEYFTAVWVKNEWSRFLKLMKDDRSKLLLPCYKDMDAYELPEEFAHIQAYDMAKIGFISEAVRRIKKLLQPEAAPAQPVTAAAAVNPAAATTGSLLDRAFLFLEDGEWQSADEYAEKVLDIDPRCGEAYLAKAMADLKVKNRAGLADCAAFENNANTAKALRFGGETVKTELNGYILSYKNKFEEQHRAAQEAVQKAKEESIRSIINRREEIASVRGLIAAGFYQTLGVKKDGTVFATGNHIRDVSDWRKIVAVAADYHSLGLKKDGTAVAVGENDFNQCNVSEWCDVVSIFATEQFSAGLQKNGSLLCTDPDNGNCGEQDIIAAAGRRNHNVYLRKDGTVIASGNNSNKQCEVSDWRDIVEISAGESHTVGLKKDGTVVAVGDNSYGQCNVSKWQNIVSVSACNDHTVGLEKDGTVVAVGDNSSGQCNVAAWNDIIAISAGYFHTVGLKALGTVVAAGDNLGGKCDVSAWKLFNNYRHYESERKIAMEQAEKENSATVKRAEELRIAKIAALTKEKVALESELPNLTGIFKSGKRKETEARLAAIETELKNLQ